MRSVLLAVGVDTDYGDIATHLHGHSVSSCLTRVQLEETVQQSAFDTIVLDEDFVSNRDESSEWVHRLSSHCPVLFVSRDTDVDNKEKIFESGSWDYLVKPYSNLELALRVKAILRRVGPSSIQVANISLQAEGKLFFVGDQEVRLSPREFSLLAVLANHVGRFFSAQELAKAAWCDLEYKKTSRIRTYIGRLRERLSDAGATPRIESKYNEGYALIL